MGDKKLRSRVFQVGIFLAVMLLTFYAVLHGQDPGLVWKALRQMSPLYLFYSVLIAIFFVSAEGCMIWYLLRSIGGKGSILRCISYSFIGFFYSGITPSATGGQPMQLYYMNKDGNSLSGSSVVLMTVAAVYKFVLVLIGLGILFFWNAPLKSYLKAYYGLYLLGLALNTLLVIVLLCIMAAPVGMKKLICVLEGFLVRVKILKPSAERLEKIDHFIGGYHDAVSFLLHHPGKVAVVVAFTFLQRCSVFFLAFLVYRGFSLQGAGPWTLMSLQASVYIAVDMLPVPGSQGITELMYANIFTRIFTDGLLMPSLYVNRGISFYFLILVSLAVVVVRWVLDKRKKPGGREASA